MQGMLTGLAQSQQSLEWVRRDSVERTRHRTDFEVLGTLGMGGFGKVYKVRNKVDSRIYAMKSVKIGNSIGLDSDDCAKVLREVQLLSSLNSENIVRYYGAWVEKGDDSFAAGESTDRGSYSGSGETASVPTSDGTGWTIRENPICHLCQSPYKDWEVSFELWGLIDAVLQPLDLCTPCYYKSIPKEVDTAKITIREKKILPDCLFILMEFCECILLEAVQKCRGEDEAIWSYFVQCVQGLAYLHANGVIHRDIKPSNIFVHHSAVKIGDLGLATHAILSAVRSEDTEESISKSSEVGTFLYTAPEVATGQYNEKCDIYSLGVLLVEIFSDFTTGMERAKVLGGLHSSEGPALPEDWVTTHPVQAKLAKTMLASDPEARPSCGQVLRELIREGILVENVVADLHAQISKLQADLEGKDREILQLRQLLEEHQISRSHIG
jgi:translation initiation factor 2-alpha kinase 4